MTNKKAIISATNILTRKKVTMTMKKPLLAFAVTVLGITLAVAFGKTTDK